MSHDHYFYNAQYTVKNFPDLCDDFPKPPASPTLDTFEMFETNGITRFKVKPSFEDPSYDEDDDEGSYRITDAQPYQIMTPSKAIKTFFNTFEEASSHTYEPRLRAPRTQTHSSSPKRTLAQEESSQVKTSVSFEGFGGMVILLLGIATTLLTGPKAPPPTSPAGVPVFMSPFGPEDSDKST